MDILSYLSELLQQRKEVGITGLGTFYKKKFPGRYDKEKQSFLPPSYALQFTTKTKADDALSKFISDKRKISTESADYYITQFVEETNKKLELEHEATLENLGRLFFTEHEGLSFEASKNINYGSEYFGLPAMQETVVEETKIEPIVDEEVYDEIAEAPIAPAQPENKEIKHPTIENVELDEVTDDLKNTLKHTSNSGEEITDAPEFIKEQHAEHPNRFGHTPENEEEVAKSLEDDQNVIVETPAEAKAKTYINLEDEKPKEEHVIEAPEFIKEQHADHPNRFGHDPIVNEPFEEEKSIWPKVIFGFLALLIIGALAYYLKPTLFNQPEAVEDAPIAIIDSPKIVVDTTKAKQDSIAKTDSILRANQISAKTDSIKKATVLPKNPVAVAPETKTSTGKITFDVIAAAYKTEAGAERYIALMKKHGLTARIVNMAGPWKKVSIGSFKTQKEAENQRDLLQKKLKGKGFYIQQIVNNTQP